MAKKCFKTDLKKCFRASGEVRTLEILTLIIKKLDKLKKIIFLTGTLDAAIWGAELAFGDGQERIFLVEPTGKIENDPDLTDKKFPGNPTQSFRSTEPFKVVGEVTVWQGHSAEQVKTMKEHLEKLKEQGINSLND